jgi:uncharacterized membrane protein
MFAIEVQIAEPPSQVFAYLADVEEAPRWYSAVQEVESLDGGPTGKGARYRFVREIGGETQVNEVEVSEFKPNRSLTLTSVSGPTPFIYRYVLMPSGEGTLLRLEGQISGDGLSGLITMLKPFAETFFRRGMAANLQTLKQVIETAARE